MAVQYDPVRCTNLRCKLDYGHSGPCSTGWLSLKDFPPPIQFPLTAIIGRNYGECMFLAEELPNRADPGFRPVVLFDTASLRGNRFVRAYASLELAPELRTDEEMEWFEHELRRALAPGVEVTYVDLWNS